MLPAPGEATPVAAQERPDLKQTLLEMERRLWAASAKQDTAALDKLLAADFVSFSRVGRYTKRDAIAATRRVRCVDLHADNLEVLRVSKDVALVSYVGRWKVLNNAGVLEEDCTNRRVTIMEPSGCTTRSTMVPSI